MRFSRLLAAFRLWRHARRRGAILDNMPLVDTLHRAISLAGIEEALQAKAIDAVAVTASSYTSGVHWTFCHTARDRSHEAWNRPGRRAEFQPLTIEHLMASSAIPSSSPPRRCGWTAGANTSATARCARSRRCRPRCTWARTRSWWWASASRSAPAWRRRPQPGGTDAGRHRRPRHGQRVPRHLQADVEQTQRVARTLQQLPREVAGVLPYRSVEVLAIQPTQSLDALAQAHAPRIAAARVRRALGGLGALKGGGGALASYLLFEPGFVQALIGLGEQDAYARKEELLAFFGTVAA